MKSYTFGIDVGGTTVKIGLFEEKNLICKWSVPTNKKDSGTNILPEIHREISEKIRECGIKPKEVKAGMGVPGPVLADGSVVGCWNLGWGYFQLKEEAEMLFRIPVEVCNDADAAALGEMWHGAAKGYKNIFMLTLGTGTGGGLLLDGKIVRGVHGCGGEWGHIQVNPEENETCVCGRKGCINQYASVSGMMHMAEKIISRQEQGMKGGLYERITKPEDIWRLAREGNQAGVAVVRPK